MHYLCSSWREKQMKINCLLTYRKKSDDWCFLGFIFTPLLKLWCTPGGCMWRHWWCQRHMVKPTRPFSHCWGNCSFWLVSNPSTSCCLQIYLARLTCITMLLNVTLLFLWLDSRICGTGWKLFCWTKTKRKMLLPTRKSSLPEQEGGCVRRKSCSVSGGLTETWDLDVWFSHADPNAAFSPSSGLHLCEMRVHACVCVCVFV